MSAGFSLSEVFGLATVVSAVFCASADFVFSAGAFVAGCAVLVSASFPFCCSLVAEAADVSSFLGSLTGLGVSFCFAFTSSVAIS